MTNKPSAVETAIRDAVEKGDWKGKGAKFNYYQPMFDDAGWYLADGYAENEHGSAIFLDSSFWQALGKARGWQESYCGGCGQVPYTACDQSDSECTSDESEWEERWVEFTRHLADGKDPESFFKSL